MCCFSLFLSLGIRENVCRQHRLTRDRRVDPDRADHNRLGREKDLIWLTL
jgi:hypothetical protein